MTTLDQHPQGGRPRTTARSTNSSSERTPEHPAPQRTRQPLAVPFVTVGELTQWTFVELPDLPAVARWSRSSNPLIEGLSHFPGHRGGPAIRPGVEHRVAHRRRS